MNNIFQFGVGVACCIVAYECNAGKPSVKPERNVALYSGTSLDDAIAFTDAPVERREKFKKAVKGALADTTHLALARKLLHARDQRDAEAFRTLLYPECKRLLNDPGEKQMVHAVARQVENGNFLYANNRESGVRPWNL